MQRHDVGVFQVLSSTFVPSRIAVHGAPSSCSSLISFSATRLSVSLLLPLKTVAYVPCRTQRGGEEDMLFAVCCSSVSVSTAQDWWFILRASDAIHHPTFAPPTLLYLSNQPSLICYNRGPSGPY
ncbi:hypothetical protein INR49_025029 [Caranx melampygus]|nr:hypothetical protein INR49_025029 [Caranx melampygus]